MKREIAEHMETIRNRGDYAINRILELIIDEIRENEKAIREIRSGGVITSTKGKDKERE